MKASALCLVLVFHMAPGGADTTARAGDQRAYETDILAQTFGYGPSEIDVDIDQVYQGCPRRDCIPSIDQPNFLPIAAVDFLDGNDLVLSVRMGGEIRAYPTRILDRHEIVNDRFGDQPLAVTYCPLCGSGLAFIRMVAGEEVELGVSGLLHKNDLIMYDRTTGSLWQQITGRALAGPLRGETLQVVPLTMGYWRDWKQAHPQGRVLAPPIEGVKYKKNAYGDYARSDNLLFPVPATDARLHIKKVIYGLELEDRSLAIESRWLEKAGSWETDIDGQLLRLEVDSAGGVTALLDQQAVPVHRMYWFAWYSFHPDTSLVNSRNH